MSAISRFELLSSAPIIDIYDRTNDPFGALSVVHPAHPMRKAQTIQVKSLSEMVYPVGVGGVIADLLEFDEGFNYAVSIGSGEKPVLRIALDNGYAFVYRLATTTKIPEDSKRTKGVIEATKGLLLRRLDALEALIWFIAFLERSFWVPLSSDPTSFREIYALARTLLSRFMPADSYDVMLSPKCYGASILENSAGVANNSEYTEPQVASGKLTLIPLAFNGFHDPMEEYVCVYPSNFPTLCKRYVYEAVTEERIFDITSDRNLYRITAERYLLIALPADYYSDYCGYRVAPIVGMWAYEALNNIRNTFGLGVMNNLEIVSRIS